MGIARLRPRRRAPGPPAPFVVGVGRSGTTLLRLMLDSHPDLAMPPETGFVPDVIGFARKGVTPAEMVAYLREQRSWGDHRLDEAELERRFAAESRLDDTTALRAFYRLYADGQGKPRWGDKTPAYVKRMPLIERSLPEARFVHVIRDGRDVSLSRDKRRLREGDAPGPARMAEMWRNRILRARKHALRVRHYTEVRYEDLVTDTEPTLRRVAEAVELEWDGAMLRYHERASERLAEMNRDLPATEGKLTRSGDERMRAHALATEPPNPSRIASWKGRMSAEDVAEFEAVAGDLLAELGYELTSGQTSGVA
jgi:hypothetical protein